jgi:hypothetical protein
MKRVYLDYASLTPIDKRVAKEMAKYSTKNYGNPSALYSSAVHSKNALSLKPESESPTFSMHTLTKSFLPEAALRRTISL